MLLTQVTYKTVPTIAFHPTARHVTHEHVATMQCRKVTIQIWCLAKGGVTGRISTAVNAISWWRYVEGLNIQSKNTRLHAIYTSAKIYM